MSHSFKRGEKGSQKWLSYLYPWLSPDYYGLSTVRSYNFLDDLRTICTGISASHMVENFVRECEMPTHGACVPCSHHCYILTLQREYCDFNREFRKPATLLLRHLCIGQNRASGIGIATGALWFHIRGTTSTLKFISISVLPSIWLLCSACRKAEDRLELNGRIKY